MDWEKIKEIINKVTKGCGCMSICFIGLLFAVALCTDDDENKKKKEEFTALEIYGEVSEGTINGREASQEAVKERFDRLPQGEPLRGYFENVPF